MSWSMLYFTLQGRIGRRTFWAASLLPLAVHVCAYSYTVHVTMPGKQGGLSTALIAGLGLSIATFAATLAIIALNTKRLHDLGRSGFWQCISLVSLPLGLAGAHALVEQRTGWSAALSLSAIILSVWGLWVLFQIWFSPGDPEANSYGAPPAQEEATKDLAAEIAQLEAHAPKAIPDAAARRVPVVTRGTPQHAAPRPAGFGRRPRTGSFRHTG